MVSGELATVAVAVSEIPQVGGINPVVNDVAVAESPLTNPW